MFKIQKTKIIFLSILFFGLFAMAGKSQAANLWTEDYENYNPSRYYDQGSQCWTLDSAHAHGGTYALAIPPTCSLYDKADLATQASSTWVWVTMHMWTPANWDISGGLVHLPSLNFGQGHYFQIDFRGNTPHTLTSIIWNDLNIGEHLTQTLPTSYFANKWTKIQWGMQYSTKSIQIWIDDANILNDANIAYGEYSGSEQVDDINIRYEPVGTGSGTVYYDDISVDTGSRPTSGDTIPPAAPQGLAVQ